MKKFWLFVLGFLFVMNVYASDVLNEINIEYINNLVTTSTRSYSNNRYIFEIDYLGDVTNLSNEQLNFLLSQSSSDYLKVFGDIKITILPDPNGKYKNIRDNIFLGYSGGMFGNSLYETVMPNDTATKENLTMLIKNPILEVYYRADENSAWSNDKGNLSGNLTLENQLATLLGIDLDTNPNGVKEKYKTNYYFKPYENSVYTNRFDFYEPTINTPATQEGNSYEVTTLSKISTEYAELKFDYPLDQTFFEIESKTNKLPYIIVTSILFCLCIFYVLKQKKII